MQLRKYVRFDAADGGVIDSYIHMGGKVGVLIEVGTTKPETASDAAFSELSGAWNAIGIENDGAPRLYAFGKHSPPPTHADGSERPVPAKSIPTEPSVKSV